MKKNNNTKVNMISAPAAHIEAPVFKVVNNKDYILYGEGNDYPSILRDMMNGSAKHNSILTKKANMTGGKGWKTEDAIQNLFVQNINGSETLDQIAYKNAYDLTLYGGFSYLVTWSKDRQSIARIQYIDFASVRRVKEMDDDSEICKRQAEGVEFYLVSSDWSQERKEKYKPKLVQGFSTEYNDEATQLVYVPMYRPGTEDTYPLPDYQAASTYIALDTEISSWHLNNVKNGFAPSMMINMVGVPSDEEMKQFQRKLESQYAGSPNAGRIILTLSEDVDQVPQITPLTLNDSDERYKDLEAQVMENIIIGHRASSAAVGRETAGKLGTSDEIIQAELQFQKNVIDQYQFLIESSYNRIMAINKIDGKITLVQAIEFNVDEVVEEDEVVNDDSQFGNRQLLTESFQDTYADYPDSAVNNAKRGIELNKAIGNKCATQVGKTRAQDIANRRGLSFETIKRTFSYLSRAEEFYDGSNPEACGTISFLLWGGKTMKTWAEAKIKSIEKDKNK
jgi:hypothetical protein